MSSLVGAGLRERVGLGVGVGKGVGGGNGVGVGGVGVQASRTNIPTTINADFIFRRLRAVNYP